jgi:hypothetical protein
MERSYGEREVSSLDSDDCIFEYKRGVQFVRCSHVLYVQYVPGCASYGI